MGDIEQSARDTTVLATPLRAPRIALVLPHLSVGGAQRVAATLANYWVNQDLDVHVIATLEEKADFYALDPRVKRKTLKRSRWLVLPGEPVLQQHLAALGISSANPADGTNRRAPPTKRQVLAAAIASRDPKLLVKLAIYAPIKLARLLAITFHLLAIDFWKACIRRQILGHNPNSYLGLMSLLAWRVSALRRELRRIAPHVVVSFLGATNVITIAAARKLPVRLVISERNDPGRQELEEPWQTLRPMIYPLADVVTANSHGALERMQAYCPSEKLAYVPNPVAISAHNHSSRSNAILFLARLVPQKAPEVLVDAFAKFAAENPGWSLQLAGDGPMESELIERVRGHGIADKVVFHGLVKDPTELLTRSRIFSLPSRFEGTPNSLLEAMAARLACVVTDASPGPLRLIEHGVSGLVVGTDNVEDLAAALHRLARDEELCSRLAAAAWERTRAFRLENVAQEWSRLLFTS